VGRLTAGAAPEEVRVAPRALRPAPVADVAAAGALLTRVPLPGGRDRTGAWAFGLVGMGLGIAASVPLALPASAGSPARGLLAMAVLAIASGALHLDGLADTADALAAPTPDAAERARTDPRAGAAGVVALVLVLGMDGALLAALLDGHGAAAAAAVVIVAAGASRASAAVVPALPAARWRDGFGRWFAERASVPGSVVAAVSAVVAGALLSVVVGWSGPAMGVAAALAIGCAVAVVLGRLRRALDGDALGAVVELSFTGALLAAALAP
jgi:adenosylcobinamide-GDP ribazoletransferase